MGKNDLQLASNEPEFAFYEYNDVTTFKQMQWEYGYRERNASD